MATLATQSVKRSGLAPAYAAAAAGGDKFTPTSGTFLHVKNSDAAAHTVTVATPKQVIPDIETGDLAVSVPAGGERLIGPFPASHFGNPADTGLAAITYDAVTGVTIAAIQVVGP